MGMIDNLKELLIRGEISIKDYNKFLIEEGLEYEENKIISLIRLIIIVWLWLREYGAIYEKGISFLIIMDLLMSCL